MVEAAFVLSDSGQKRRWSCRKVSSGLRANPICVGTGRLHGFNLDYRDRPPPQSRVFHAHHFPARRNAKRVCHGLRSFRFGRRAAAAVRLSRSPAAVPHVARNARLDWHVAGTITDTDIQFRLRVNRGFLNSRVQQLTTRAYALGSSSKSATPTHVLKLRFARRLRAQNLLQQPFWHCSLFCFRFEQPDKVDKRCGGESVSQSPLKDKAFLTFLDRSPPFELRP